MGLKRIVEAVYPKPVPPFKHKQHEGAYWWTDEKKPRKVNVLGRAAIDPDVSVVEVQGIEKKLWMMDCGSTFDGHLYGLEGDVYARPLDRTKDR